MLIPSPAEGGKLGRLASGEEPNGSEKPLPSSTLHIHAQACTPTLPLPLWEQGNVQTRVLRKHMEKGARLATSEALKDTPTRGIST